MKHIHLKLIILLLVSSLSATAQQKLQKFKKTVNANKEVIINLNTSHTNIEVDTWSKDQIEIEAYIEGEKMSKEELEKELKNWNITVNGSGDEVTIESKGTGNSWTNSYGDFDHESMDALRHLEFELADMPEMPEMPELPEMAHIPHMPEMPKMPELPELPNGIGAVNFDYDAYKKDGEKYLEKWSKEYEDDYGKEYKDKMKAWGREFGKTDFEAYSKRMEEWGEKFGKEFGDKFGKDYEKKMEAWGKNFESQWGPEFEQRMEAWGARFEKQMKDRTRAIRDRKEAMRDLQDHMEDRQEHLAERREEIARRIERKIDTKVKKTIKIKMPKKARLKMNVRHGELKFASVITNMRGDLSHSALTANSIDGRKTSINVSYSPVLISNWNMGELNLNFVDKAQIDTVNRLVLSSNSSNININSLAGNAVIDGSFGELTINTILPSFINLNIVLENSEAYVVLPKSDYNLQYKGSRSKLKHPKNKTTTTSTFSTGDLSSAKTIFINAKFSEVTMQ
jgi:PHD/YefM family antitoxin component YafN of YafNO toxin-antitoxin module